ncbi:MAG: right-handed parallel beta-helix repeat-containing protein [Verrucomicrobia bacterium]|nr:right-handed parallel beta-helix repeat-containing protein [Verrucomicrobiota bacterium]MBV8276441.1 right-handed parallel beta-helix repeat-containing protein [Verrucomicrobiota bacterium]
MKGLDFRVLVRNQWFIVSSLVGLVALGATMVDVFTGKFGSSSTTNQSQNSNQAGNQVTPQPQRVVSKPKHGRQWVLDSTGAGDSDAKDFSQIINSLEDGDTVELRAGSYNGPLTLAKSVVITGDTDQKTGARASIRYSGGTGCAITGGQVTFQNLDFSETSEGGSVLVSVSLQSVVQINNCNLVSRGSNCVGSSDNAQLTLQDSSLRTLGKGYGCYVKGNAKATIERCNFEENLGCVDCVEAGSVVINDCKFQNNITDSKDAFLILQAGTGSSEVNRCTFTENTTAIASAQGTMTLTNCRFEKNREGYWKYIVAASASGKLRLSACEFVSNPRAVLVSNGAQMVVEGCKFESGGQIPKGGDLPANFANLLALGQGSVATVTNTTFTDIQFAGVLVADQAHASLKDTTIQGGQYGIDLGVSETNQTKGGYAELENVTLSGQTGQAARLTRASYLKMFNCHIDGDAWDSSIYVDTGSTLEMAGCEVKAGKGNGLEAVAANSQAHAQQCQFLSFQSTGVLGRDRAKIALVGCTLEQNDIGAQADENGMVTLENCTVGSNRTYGVSAIRRGYVGLTTTTFTDQPNQTFKDPVSSVRVSLAANEQQ